MLNGFPAFALDGPLSPEDSLRHFQTEPGLRVELVAAEPMVVDPVAIAWDERGRMFVVENRGYPIGPGEGKSPEGQIVLLEDTDADGQYDKRTIFADGLTFPNGVMPWDGGVYVTCAPDLFYFKDTDGDGKADARKVVFTGFQDESTTQLRVSHPMLSLDNWVYLTSGLTAGKILSPANPNHPPVTLNRVDARFRPGTDEIQSTSGTAQFGQSFDAFGRRFICSNRNHIQHVVIQARQLQRNPHLRFSQVVEDIPDHGAACRIYPLSANIVTAAYHGGYITSACGLTIYLGTALPAEYRGNAFVCEPAANLVHRDVLEPNGVTFVARRAYPTNEFLSSPDNWFRPVNLAVGPDGALYVCDMYRKTIEHPEYLPEATRRVTDFESGKGMGRIYRLVAETPKTKNQTPKKFQTRKRFDLGKSNTKELCDQLENPNQWWRMTAQRLLLERQNRAALPLLAILARNGKSPEGRVHALRTLDAMNSLTDDLLLQAMSDVAPPVREHAIELTAMRAGQNSGLRRKLLSLANDSDACVRFQCALALGNLPESQAASLLADIVMRDPEVKWMRAAVLSSIAGREAEFFQAVRPQLSGKSSAGISELMGELGHILGASQPEQEIFSILAMVLASTNSAERAWQIAAVAGLGEAVRTREFTRGKSSVFQHLVGGKGNVLSALLESLFAYAGEISLDTKQPMASRLAAVQLLGQSDYATAGESLEKLLDPQHPPEIHTAAIRALNQFSELEIGRALTKPERWNAFTPAVRDAALTFLMSKPDLLNLFFDAIESGHVPAWTVSVERRNQLMKHRDEKVRRRAESAFHNLTSGDRMKIYEEHKSVLALEGDAKNGRTAFQKNCMSCHTFAGEGHLVGPDLTGIRNQPADVLLLHIIVPDFEMMPIYTAYNVETKNDDAYTGLLAAESPDSITLRMAQGLEQKIPRAEIKSMSVSRFSLMPQELEKTMTRQELADLLAFLKGK